MDDENNKKFKQIKNFRKFKEAIDDMNNDKNFKKDVLDNNEIECNICQLTIGNVDNIIDHFKKRHKFIWDFYYNQTLSKLQD